MHNDRRELNMTDIVQTPEPTNLTLRHKIGLILGPVVFFSMVFSNPPDGLSTAGWYTAATALLIAIWWVSEAIPLSVTAFLPILLFPVLGISSVRDTAVPYMHPIILLLIGGFMIALGMQRWGLHKRIALNIVARVGTKPANVIGGFMLAAALISMWVFNTTTTLMMLPIALSVVELMRSGASEAEQPTVQRFGTALMIGVAYGATIGGAGTLIGTAPNAVVAGFMSETYDITISFVEWMMVGVPMIALMLPIAWLILTRVVFPVDLPGGTGANPIADQLKALGPMSRGERIVLTVIAVTAALWIFRPLIDQAIPFITLNDTSIAMFGALALFLIPVEPRKGIFAMSGEWAKNVPWSVVILFGGGLSLAGGIKSSGLADWIGAATSGLAGLPTIAIILIIIVLMVYLTELTSNTATTSTFLPIVAAVAIGIGENPMLFAFPTVLAASCAFMMPVATPPNAVVFASGQITMIQFVRAGFWTNIAGIGVVMALTYAVVLWVFGIELGVLPEWAKTAES